jgi:putative phosphoribosyl transferase
LAEDLTIAHIIPLLAERLVAAAEWLHGQDVDGLPPGCFGPNSGAAAVLIATAELGDRVKAVALRRGRPDLAREQLGAVRAPTLLLVGGADRQLLLLNRQAQRQLGCSSQLAVLPRSKSASSSPLVGRRFAVRLKGVA